MKHKYKRSEDKINDLKEKIKEIQAKSLSFRMTTNTRFAR